MYVSYIAVLCHDRVKVAAVLASVNNRGCCSCCGTRDPQVLYKTRVSETVRVGAIGRPGDP